MDTGHGGTYDPVMPVCARCGEDISEKRLEAVPWATVCVECQERAELENLPSPLALIGLQDDAETEPLP